MRRKLLKYVKEMSSLVFISSPALTFSFCKHAPCSVNSVEYSEKKQNPPCAQSTHVDPNNKSCITIRKCPPEKARKYRNLTKSASSASLSSRSSPKYPFNGKARRCGIADYRSPHITSTQKSIKKLVHLTSTVRSFSNMANLLSVS